jgi:hypothetical protein
MLLFTSIVAQFPNVNPYHWPGWLMLSLAATQGLAILVLFWEPRPFTTQNPSLDESLLLEIVVQAHRSVEKVFLLCFSDWLWIHLGAVLCADIHSGDSYTERSVWFHRGVHFPLSNWSLCRFLPEQLHTLLKVTS